MTWYSIGSIFFKFIYSNFFGTKLDIKSVLLLKHIDISSKRGLRGREPQLHYDFKYSIQVCGIVNRMEFKFI